MTNIAIDAMGGDLGVHATIKGADYFLLELIERNEQNGVCFEFFGKSELIKQEIENCLCLKNSCYKITHTENVIDSEMKPSYALRHGKGTSMLEAIRSVSDKKNDAVVSSGNTGAYMALSKIILKTIDTIDRPALVSLLPHHEGQSVALDLGANVDCSANNLIQFAIMGKAVAKVLLNIENPKIGILNIGTESSKGSDAVKGANEFLINQEDMNYFGFIEGSDLLRGVVDVIVSDGFSGNIALKTIEGTIKFFGKRLKIGVEQSILGKIAYIFGKGILKDIKNYIDPAKHNGASLVGLNGIAIKSHGNSDYIGFAHAIRVAYSLAKSGFIDNIKDAISLS